MTVNVLRSGRIRLESTDNDWNETTIHKERVRVGFTADDTRKIE